jgi:hypothetical protein
MNYFKDKKNIAILTLIILIILVTIFVIISFKKNTKSEVNNLVPKNFKGQVIDDNIHIPNTTVISNTDGEVVPRGEYSVKLQPQSETEQAYVLKAKLTLKEAYGLADIAAIKWAGDSKLVFIKSNGALGLDGRSSSWQIVFSSDQNKRAYEVIISADQIVSAKEVDSLIDGFDLPANWYDSYEAIASLRIDPQFAGDTISAISFYYSGAEKSWAYGIASGDKTTAMWVK